MWRHPHTVMSFESLDFVFIFFFIIATHLRAIFPPENFNKAISIMGF